MVKVGTLVLFLTLEEMLSMKGEINNNTIIVGDFNTPLTPMDRSTKQKINKETQTLKDRMALTPVTRLRILKKEQDKGAHFHHYYST